jgi:hypothetical protein
MTHTAQVLAFLQAEKKYNFWIKNAAGRVFGKSLDNSSFDTAETAAKTILARLAAGQYVCATKETKGTGGDTGIVELDFTVASNTQKFVNSSAMSEDEYKRLRESIEREIRNDIAIRSLQDFQKETEKYFPILKRLLENDKTVFRMLADLADGDDDNDGNVFAKAKENIGEIVELVDMFNNLKPKSA